MPRVIFKCPYLKGGSERAASHLHNYVRYMATREGAQHMAIGHEQLPATEEQRKMVAQLLREFPLSRGLFEYEDYQTAPTRGNASEFITRALEDNYDQIAKRDNYVSYIASRPRAQRAGAHALFTGSDAPLVLSQIAAEVARHPGNVWLPIISLRREDAARLGYDDAGQWKNLIAGYAMEMAEAMKIPWEQFRWYAAFHDQGHHPHIHMVCYSADGRSGYLTREGIARIKSDLAKRIFHQELHELYERQTQRRDELTQEAGVVMAELVQQMWEGTLDNPRIEQFMEHLAGKLKNLSGKKQYGYLRAPLKAVVDEIVDELARDERVARAYELWYELREEVLRTYREDLPPRLLLSRQKEFKRIRNMVIEEALRLGYRRCVWNKGGVKRAVWRCGSRLDYGAKYCKHSETLEEKPLQQAILNAINSVMDSRDALEVQLMGAMEQELAPIPGETMSLADIDRMLEELEKQFNSLLAEASAAGGTEDYAERFRMISNAMADLKEHKSRIKQVYQENELVSQRLKAASIAMSAYAAELTEWDQSVVYQLVEKVTVLAKDKIRVTFRNGTEVEQEIEQLDWRNAS